MCLFSRSDVCCCEQSLKDFMRGAGSIKVLFIRTVIITNTMAVNLEIKYNTQYCNGVASVSVCSGAFTGIRTHGL